MKVKSAGAADHCALRAITSKLLPDEPRQPISVSVNVTRIRALVAVMRYPVAVRLVLDPALLAPASVSVSGSGRSAGGSAGCAGRRWPC